MGAVLAALAVLIGVVLYARAGAAKGGDGKTPSCPTEEKLRSLETEVASGKSSPEDAEKLAKVYLRLGCVAAHARLVMAAARKRSGTGTPPPSGPPEWVMGCVQPADFTAPSDWKLGEVATSEQTGPYWSPPAGWRFGDPPGGECPPGWGVAGEETPFKGFKGTPLPHCDPEVAALPDGPYPVEVGAYGSAWWLRKVRSDVAAVVREGDPVALRKMGDFLGSVAEKVAGEHVGADGTSQPADAALAAVYANASRCLLARADKIEDPSGTKAIERAFGSVRFGL